MHRETSNAEPTRGTRASFAGLLVVCSAATAAAVVWLLAVSVTILPSRDPAHVLMWRAIAAGMLAFSALSAAHLARGQSTIVSAALLVFSLAAFAAGIFGIARIIARAKVGGEFEGYILLLGAILIAHGTVGALHALRGGRGGEVLPLV